ncbi:predicted protein [Histoplasma capsulatum G186AR]|uniref:Uncharacterized protein n=1 Tax=Ajellomyces capsulatus (strain G186AR / H82 / ATCC MYA-2454 / RMSCC 2432) TaxID=447093 RepID=C0NAR3_AJECG|nr:uncharacterized protein HCBG_00209 [Histoplasma capsulatum G186AR]EEH10754.1 predicted protein [Histoplasma capsulatum G186AR]
MSKKSREWVKQRKIQAEDERFQGQAEGRPGTTVEYHSTSLDLQVEGDGQCWSARSGWRQETWRGLSGVDRFQILRTDRMLQYSHWPKTSSPSSCSTPHATLDAALELGGKASTRGDERWLPPLHMAIHGSRFIFFGSRFLPAMALD